MVEDGPYLDHPASLNGARRTVHRTSVSVAPGRLTAMTADIVPTATGRTVAAPGLGGWLGTMSPHTARAYQVDLRQFTGWIAAQQISPDRVTPGVPTSWLADLAAAGQQVATAAANSPRCCPSTATPPPKASRSPRRYRTRHLGCTATTPTPAPWTTTRPADSGKPPPASHAPAPWSPSCCSEAYGSTKPSPCR